ncbi:MAG TPA: hypothetical protein VIX12_08725 [Candidatus Binataceae bacterium]
MLKNESGGNPMSTDSANAAFSHSQAQADGLLERLERHRDHRFRRIRTRRVTGEKTALAFIKEAGFCAAFTAGLGVPCLREAIAGEREPGMPEHIQHDYAIGMTWRLKDTLPARKLVYYGKVIGGRPGFIARDLIGAFLKLRVEPASYRKLYERGRLSHCGKLVMDALARRGPAETRALKLASGYAQPSRRAAFDRAMKELQEKFLALKVDERSGPFSYVWDTVEHRWSEAFDEARALTRSEAAYMLVRRYFELAAFGNEHAVARILGVEPHLVASAAKRIARERLVTRGTRIEGLAGEFTVLREFVPASRG